MRKTGGYSNGFTLAELMIGLSIGLVVIAGATYLFGIVRSQDRWIQQQAEINATTRYLLLRLNPAIRQSGYYGISASATRLRFMMPGTGKSTCGQLPWEELIRRRTSGFVATPGIPRCIRQNRKRNRYLRGDALVLNLTSATRQAKTTPYSIKHAKFEPDVLYVHSRLHQQTIFSGRLAKRLLNQPTLSLRRLRPAIYYIGDHPDVSCQKKTVPGLIRITRTRSGRFRREMLVQGFEHFRLAFGVATGKRHRTLVYRSPDQVRHWHRVRTLRYWMLLRSRCPAWRRPQHQQYRLYDEVYQRHDRYYRKRIVMTVAVRNPARREKSR